MSGMIDRRIAIAGRIEEHFGERGDYRRAGEMRGIKQSLAHFRGSLRPTSPAKLTAIAKARMIEAAALNSDLETGATQLERMAKIADTGGAGFVEVRVEDAAFIAALLRRAMR